jgi:hypothetical protein
MREILDEDELSADWNFNLSLEEVLALDTNNVISIKEN